MESQNEEDSSTFSCVSLKSDQSMGVPLRFSSGDMPADESLVEKESAELSYVSLKSDQSMGVPFKFSSGDNSDDERQKQDESKAFCLESIFKEAEHKIITLIKEELRSFKSLLNLDYTSCSKKEQDDEGQSIVRDYLLKITLYVLKNMKQHDLANKLQTKHAPMFLKNHKSRLKEKFQRTHEGISNQGSYTLLNKIYTDLYVIEGGTGEINNEHEVRQIETTRSEKQKTSIKCNNIFKASLGPNTRTVLTKGIAGIGKTVSVQKFILDWAEGKDNQDFHFIFPLPFRELNLLKETNHSLIGVLNQLFTDTKHLRITDFVDYKVLFIFDGLDECRFNLDFQHNISLSDVTESASVDVLLTNLMKGNLLPHAQIWITSRPAAANQIPPECIDLVTEVRGFNDPQKDEYFRKRINDESLATRIITHLKSSRSLYIMCHMPVFCWISASVLQRMLCEAEIVEIPKTLTQMFTHFLIFQMKVNSQKYNDSAEFDVQKVRKSLLSLGKLAFQQLEKGNLIFYEEDLRECDIDVREASVYSGVCTQIFIEEPGLYLSKVYSFVHLSIQEFLAAFFKCFFFEQDKQKGILSDLLKSEVDKALQSENGHWDLYLRFLLGLSLESNQILLRDLMPQLRSNSDRSQEINKYIKQIIEKDLAPEKSINLFHCLNELNDNCLVQEVQKYFKRNGSIKRKSEQPKVCPAMWAALVFVLLNSEQEEFKLSKYDPSDESLQRLLPVVKASRNADVSGCNLTERSFSALASVLSSKSSNLIELNLSDNKLQDSGMKLISDGLANPNCKLKILKLCDCNITEEGCVFLASALRSNPAHIRELNLSSNIPGDSGVKLLSDLLNDPHCQLENLCLCDCNITEDGFVSLVSALRSNPSHIRDLNLSRNIPGDSGVKLLSDLLNDPSCQLKKLRLCDCKIREEGCIALTLALRLNPLHLTELYLSGNNPGDSGIMLLSNLLEYPHCQLKILHLERCSIGAEGCAALISALRSNHSHLTELSLSGNKPGVSGVKLFSDLLEDPHCKLEKLQLSDCDIGEEGCVALASALKSNPSPLRELDLSSNNIKKDSQSKLKEIHVSDSAEDISNLEK